MDSSVVMFFNGQRTAGWRHWLRTILLLLLLTTSPSDIHIAVWPSSQKLALLCICTPLRVPITIVIMNALMLVRAWCAGAGQPERAAAAAGRRVAPAAAPSLPPPQTLSRTGGAQWSGRPRPRHARAVRGARLRGRGGRGRRPARRGRLCAGAAAALAAGRRGRAPGRPGVPALSQD